MCIWCLQIDNKTNKFFVRISAIALKKSLYKKIMALYRITKKGPKSEAQNLTDMTYLPIGHNASA